MLSVDFVILRLFALTKRWSPESAAIEINGQPRYVRKRFEALFKRRLICKILGKYELTDEGREALREAHSNPVLRDPHPWIARVRAGIDSEGHQLKMKGRAAIPGGAPPELSYTVDMEDFLDRKRAGEFDDLIE